MMMVVVAAMVAMVAVVLCVCAPSAPAFAKISLNTLRSRLPLAGLILMPLLPETGTSMVSPGLGERRARTLAHSEGWVAECVQVKDGLWLLDFWLRCLGQKTRKGVEGESLGPAHPGRGRGREEGERDSCHSGLSA